MTVAPRLPHPRGPLSEAVIDHLRGAGPLCRPRPGGLDTLTDDDLHLALWCCYELHHHGFAGVPDGLEWSPELIAFRTVLERAFERALRREHAHDDLPDEPRAALLALAERPGPPLAATVARGTREQLVEFALHRSAYQLKEADGHTWGLPRLRGPARSAMIEIQIDEYGGGAPGRSHAEIFAAGLRDLGLDDAFGAHVDRLPGATLATDNLVELFGLHRRLRGALVGHLALFERTSVMPMAQYLLAARRHGPLPSLERFYEVHVEADVHHGRLALDRLVGGFVEHEPALASDVVFGAAALARVEARFAARVLGRWATGRSSLLDPPLEVAAGSALAPPHEATPPVASI